MNPAIFENLYQEEIYQLKGKVIVLIPVAWGALGTEEKNQLAKILQAVKLSVESVHILSRQEADMDSLAVYYPTRIISFGTLLKSEIPLYEHRKWNEVSIIHADKLDNLDDAKKRNLWLALKQMFNL